ncbi:MAG: type III-A CRISPR-associated RAMP protein Csm3 [Tepidanaerobacter sp.]|jgi:CRISPR-associated protein Csm3|nr:type III-A CRISPR-associated RAMP protein Csm3 [Tepidanaerobacter sp.]
MKLKKIKVIKGRIFCETGLHIGGSQDEIEIGGVDLPVIKHPITKEPYIPGSSLKGKMRSTLERKYDKVTNKGEPCGCGKEDCLICRVFGPHKNTSHSLGPTRILVRDSKLSQETRNEYKELAVKGGVLPLENKTENIINRLKGTAEHPRSLERVPAGSKFDMEIAVQIFEGDNEQDIIDFIKEGLLLVQETYLGGFGSRGSGKVKFQDLTIDGEAFTLGREN